MNQLLVLAQHSAAMLSEEFIARYGLDGIVPYADIQPRVDASDVVIALWPDPTKPDGYDWLPIKLGDDYPSETSAGTWVLGLPCTTRWQAAQAREMFGTRHAGRGH